MKLLTEEERVKRALARHPDWSNRRISKVSRSTMGMVELVKAGAPVPAQLLSPAPVEEKSSGMISIKEVIDRYDIKAAILRELAGLKRGKLISETELCRRTAGTDRNRFRRCIENNSELFHPLRIKLRLDEGEPKWWWGNAEEVAKALEIRDE